MDESIEDELKSSSASIVKRYRLEKFDNDHSNQCNVRRCDSKRSSTKPVLSKSFIDYNEDVIVTEARLRKL